MNPIVVFAYQMALSDWSMKELTSFYLALQLGRGAIPPNNYGFEPAYAAGMIGEDGVPFYREELMEACHSEVVHRKTK